jgi:asparagine synthase (glutamine-hydrolysing)
MCGIVAVVSREKPWAEESLVHATQRLLHRGPDEQHHWLSANGQAGLGHTRLSIIDLSTGAQPIANEDETLRIVVNGEFYDFERIRSELEGRGHRFRTRTDSEIALHLYEEKGVDCLDDLRGEFAFALWDEKNDTLFAARDRFGIKPLFYARIGGAIVIASEVKALFAAGAPAAWDSESVFHNIFLGQHEDRTLFDGVRQVPAGHYLLSTRDATRVVRYWDADYPRAGAATDLDSEEACVGRVRGLLEECVRLRMRADVPVGCYVSGGVDSSAVLGMAASHAGRGVAAFTIAFDHPDFDESASARRSAAHAGADFHPIAVTEADFADCFADAVWQGETIQYNAHGPARYLLSKAVQKAGYKVVMAGEGADELFAGYAFARSALLGAGNRALQWPRRLFRLLRPRTQQERVIASTSSSLERACRVIGVPGDLKTSLAERLGLLRSIIAPGFAATFRDRDPFREFMAQFDARRSLSGREPVKQILYLWLKSLFVNYVLAGERLDMAHAVEVRLPFLDHKLFELTRNIPAAVLAQGGGRKQLLRKAMKPYITEEVYRGEKQPFFGPPSTLRVGNPLYTYVQDLLRSEAFRAVPFFDRPAVIALLDRLPQMDDTTRSALDPLVLMLASMTVLNERYGLA